MAGFATLHPLYILCNRVYYLFGVPLDSHILNFRKIVQKKDRAELKELHPENLEKLTDTPTAERLFNAFSKITLTIINSGNSIIRHLTPLTDLQKNIFKRLGLNCSIYKYLEFEKSPYKLSEW